jgi:hypothetical protein
MNSKSWFLSKTIWLNILLSLMGILTLIADALEKNPTLTVSGILMLAVGCIGIVIRYFYTNQPLK